MSDADDKDKGFDILIKAGGRALALRFFLLWVTVTLAHTVLLVGRIAYDPIIIHAELIPYCSFSIMVFLEWLLLRRRTLTSDVRIFEIVTFLVGIGIAMQFRMGTFDYGASLGFMLALPIGLASMLAIYLIAADGRWKHLSKIGYIFYAAAVSLLLAMLVFGRKYRGGIYLPGNVNPSEIVKLFLVIFLSSFLSNRKKELSSTFLGFPVPRFSSFLLLAILWLIPVALVMALHDLGLILLLNAVLVIMLYAATRSLGYLILGGIGVVGAGYLLQTLSSHVHARFSAWLNPFADPTGSGWQILQSLSAMYAGGIWGAGIGAGSPSAIPIVTTDFVYAAIAEELGLVICALLIVLFGCLFVRGFRAAGRTDNPFGKLLATGLTAALAVQTILNIGGVVKAVPLTGIVLPFLSQGGSGLIAMLAMAGLLAAISTGELQKNKK